MLAVSRNGEEIQIMMRVPEIFYMRQNAVKMCFLLEFVTKHLFWLGTIEMVNHKSDAHEGCWGYFLGGPCSDKLALVSQLCSYMNGEYRYACCQFRPNGRCDPKKNRSLEVSI